MYPDCIFNCLHFGHGLLIFLILTVFWLSEASQICSFGEFSCECIGGIGWTNLVISKEMEKTTFCILKLSSHRAAGIHDCCVVYKLIHGLQKQILVFFVWKFGFGPGEVMEKSWNFFLRFLWEPCILIYLSETVFHHMPSVHHKHEPSRSGPLEVESSHYSDVIMSTIASLITSLAVVYSTVYSDADQRKHQSSASLAFVWGIHRDRWIPRTKGQLRGKCFHLMTSSCPSNVAYMHQWTGSALVQIMACHLFGPKTYSITLGRESCETI